MGKRSILPVCGVANDVDEEDSSDHSESLLAEEEVSEEERSDSIPSESESSVESEAIEETTQEPISIDVWLLFCGQS